MTVPPTATSAEPPEEYAGELLGAEDMAYLARLEAAISHLVSETYDSPLAAALVCGADPAEVAEEIAHARPWSVGHAICLLHHIGLDLVGVMQAVEEAGE